jgi:hypothetical protein
MALYTVLRGTRIDTLHVYKCTGDPETPGNWSVQDTYVLDAPIYTIWGKVQGSDIHIAVACFGTLNQHPRDASYVKYLRFDPGTDLFIQTDVGNNYYDDAVDNGDASHSTFFLGTNAQVGATIEVRSDGDVVIGYANIDDKLAYSVKESGTWTRGTVVASTANAVHAVAVLGDSDRVHFFYYDPASTADLFHRSLSSANVLGTESVVDAGMGVESGNQIAGAVTFDDGTKRVRVAYSDGASIPANIAAAYGNDQENPSWTIETNASDDDPQVIGENIIADLVLNGDDSWLVYSAVTDSDIWADVNDGIGGWGTDTEEVPNVTCAGLSAGVYDRSGQQLGIVWYDTSDTDMHFTEKSLAAGPVTVQVSITEGQKAGDTKNGLASAIGNVLDGAEVSDTGIGLASAIGSIQDGAEVSDTWNRFKRSFVLIDEGVEVGEVKSARADSIGELTDGVDLGDTESAIADSIGELTDGVDLGDTESAIATALATIVEGSKSGDTPGGLADALALLLEGVETGDALIVLASAFASISEGIKAGETWAAEAMSLASVVEGVKVGDIQASPISGEIIEGVKTGENFLAAVQAIATVLEGTKAGEVFSGLVQGIASTTEGTKVGENILGVSQANALQTDGIETGENILGEAQAGALWTDGIDVGELISALAQAIASVVEGAKAGDDWIGVEAGGAIVQGVILEGSKSGEIFLASAQALTSIVEGTIVSEVFGAEADTTGIMNEGLLTGEIFERFATIQRTFTDGIKTSETFLGSAIGIVTLLEGIQMGDIWSATANAKANIVEGEKSGDTFVGSLLAQIGFVFATIQVIAAVASTLSVTGKLSVSDNLETKPSVDGEPTINEEA